jgi:protein gp37
MKLAGTRLQHHPSRAGLTVDTTNGPVWNGQVRFNEQWLNQPLEWKRPRRIFVCAHGDLFHESVPNEWIDKVFAVMALAPWHTFQVLTKRPERMKAYLQPGRAHPVGLEALAITFEHHSKHAGSEIGKGCKLTGNIAHLQVWPLPNVWLGVSVENQEAADERIPLLLQTPAVIRWISAEPLLGPVSFRWAAWHDYNKVGGHHHLDGMKDIDWVVAGGESGLNARPMHPDWVQALRDQCNESGVAFLFKQWGEYAEDGQHGLATGVFGSIRIHQFHDGRIVERIGKKAAGRNLDGRTWDEYPKAAS